jgi:FdhE protein
VSLARASASSRLDTIEREHPEWRGWLALVREVSRELADGAWAACVPSPGETWQAQAPLLAGRVIAVDSGLVRSWVNRLLATATTTRTEPSGLARGRRTRSTHAESLRLFQASIAEDAPAIDALASDTEFDRAALHAVWPLVAMPLLHACRRVWRDTLARDWDRGSCPLCGAWPMLAEARGLERTRRLRCGRCASDWAFDWLRCPYCDNRDHTSLDSLVPESSREARKVEACRACGGYVKSAATLQALDPDALLVEDLATVSLDVAALERGYRRPSGPRHRLDVRLREDTSWRRRAAAWLHR